MKTKNGHILTFSEKMQISAILCFATCDWFCPMTSHMLYPSDPMQPGPMYFLVPRRCQLFGIRAEGVSKQINYLIDEAVNCGKGANVVICLLHHFFQNFGFGESLVSLHADNYTGQNKNIYLLWYFAWHCMLGFHTQIDLCFMLAGQTKFSPDWAFGLLKRFFFFFEKLVFFC